jgi:hypothetical protein
MYARLVSVFFFLLPALLHASEIRGKVVSVIGGEPLARVQVTVLETGAQTVTAGNGTFSIQNLAPGNYTLRLNAVGYRLVTVPFSLTVGEQIKEFEVTLAADNFRRTETGRIQWPGVPRHKSDQSHQFRGAGDVHRTGKRSTAFSSIYAWRVGVRQQRL